MARRFPLLSLASSQWMILAAIVLLVLLSVGYVRRVTESVAVRAELAEWEKKVEAERARRELLEDQLARVKSDEYVDQQARRVLGWVKPGDVPIEVVIAEPPEPTPESTPPQTTPVSSTSPWRAWWNLFFGP